MTEPKVYLFSIDSFDRTDVEQFDKEQCEKNSTKSYDLTYLQDMLNDSDDSADYLQHDSYWFIIY